MFCINCGKQLEEGSRFCPYCGARVPDLTASAPAEPGYPNGQSGEPGPDAGAPNPFQQQNPASGETGGDPGQAGYWGQPSGGDPGQSGTGYQGQTGTDPWGQPSGGDPGQSATGYQGQTGTDPWGQPSGGDPGQSGTGYQGQTGTDPWGQPSGGDPGQSATGYQGQTGTDPWGQPSGGDPGQSGTGYQGQTYGGYQNFNQNQNKGGFDPWAMKGGPGQTGGPAQGDPWGPQGTVATAPAKPPKKKHTVRNIILIAVGVVVLALVGLYILGSTLLGKYEPLVKSYLSYAEQSDVQRVESLFYPEIVDNYHMIFGDTEAIYYLDSWTDNYGQKVDRYEISEMDDEDDELQYFNELYGVQATEYVDVTVMVYYDSGRYSCMDFDMVHIDGSWYLAYIW